MAAVCLACVAVALALGKLIPWPFLQNAAADFVGGLLAGLLIFYLANIAFGFTERREKERHALRIAFRMLLVEMLENEFELRRIVIALRGGSLCYEDPVFWEDERVKADDWQLLAQGPLVEHLSPDLFMLISVSYHASRSFVNNLRSHGLALGAGNPQAWKDLCKRHLLVGESALEFVTSAHNDLHSAHDSMKGS
jgi:hypothetical protein